MESKIEFNKHDKMNVTVKINTAEKMVQSILEQNFNFFQKIEI